MNEDIAKALLRQLDADGHLKIGPAPEKTAVWLRRLFDHAGLPGELYRVLLHQWPAQECEIGPITIHGSDELAGFEEDETYIATKLLPIGVGPNSDRFAIDFSVDSCPVGFVEFSEYDQEGDPRPFFQPAARSLESFLYRIAEKRFFPCDFYESASWNDFLRAEATHQLFPPYAPNGGLDAHTKPPEDE